MIAMEAKDVLLKLRTERGLSQETLAEKLFVTRQAVSRWERGDTLPNTETLKLLSKLYDVSINTLLGSPRTLICQCCGMPLDDTTISREPGGAFNEDYCKWCYTDGNLRTVRWKSCWRFWCRTCQMMRGRRSRCARIWRTCCQS